MLDCVADLIKKLELCLTVVSVLLKIRFGHAQISVKSVYRCPKQPVSTLDIYTLDIYIYVCVLCIYI